MWLAEMVKRRLGGLFQGYKTCPPPPLKSDDSEKDVPGPDDDFHGLEAGQWPGHVPSPGYLGVGLSYVSLALCVAGIVTLHRCTIIQVRRGNLGLKLYSLLFSSGGYEAGDPPGVPGDDHFWHHCLHLGKQDFQEGAKRTDRPHKGKLSLLTPSQTNK